MTAKILRLKQKPPTRAEADDAVRGLLIFAEHCLREGKTKQLALAMEFIKLIREMRPS